MSWSKIGTLGGGASAELDERVTELETKVGTTKPVDASYSYMGVY